MHHGKSKQWLNVLAILSLGFMGIGCRKNVEPPEPEEARTAPAVSNAVNAEASSAPAAVQSQSSQSSVQQSVAEGSAAVAAKAPATPAVAPASDGDPLNGKFTLQDATKGLAPTGKLVAEIATDGGKLKCELFDDKAPKAVANFIGLARGLRPFKDPKTGQWVKRPGYDGTVFHRIIKGFMIQGGDPAGTGAGEPGYVFDDEVWPGATHDRRGLLCMANRGPNTNGMQFFILDAAAKHLDRSFTIFGSCGPDAVIEKLASSEVRGDRAVNPPKITKVTIRRGK
jgi:peptidyl-prolyl cis-trans isomerase A (cyclophilin A)